MSGELRDLIYFDSNKAASLFSQADNGLLKEIQEKREEIYGRNASGSFDAKIIKGGLGSDAKDTTSILESRALHHDLLTRLEDWLKKQGRLLDLNTFTTESPLDFSNEAIHRAIRNPSLLTAEGWTEIQDFDRLVSAAPKINDLAKFTRRNTIEQIKKSPEYQSAQAQLEQQKQIAKAEKNRDVRARIQLEISVVEKRLQETVSPGEDSIPDWMIEGMKLINGTLMPNRLLLRLYPFEQNPAFSIIANLKRDCFLDTDFENVLFAYGARPNALLTVFGLTTSVPSAGAHPFDSASGELGSTDEQRQLQGAFRQMFNATEGIERLTRFSYYPNITIYPIAVYQRLGSLVPDEDGEEITK